MNYTEEREKIMQVLKLYFKLCEEGKAEIDMADIFAEDIMNIDKQKILSKKDTVMDRLKERIRMERMKCSIKVLDEHIHIYEDAAVFCGKIYVECATGKELISVQRMQSAVLKKEQDDWKICMLHDSADKEYEDNRAEFTEKNISGGLMSCYDTEGYPLRYVNDNLVNLLGYTKDEFWEKYGEHSMNIVYPDDREYIQQEFEKAVEENQDWKFRHRVLAKDGSVFHMLIRGRRSEDVFGNAIIVHYSIDITDMVHMEEQLANQSEELQAQNEELSQLSSKLSLNEERFRIALSKSASTIFDYDMVSGEIIIAGLAKDMPEKTIRLEEAPHMLLPGSTIYEADLEKFYRMFQKIKTGQKEAERDIRAVNEKGRITWYRFSLTEMLDETGKPFRAIGVAEEVTSVKEKEIELLYKVSFDSMTEVYNKHSAIERIERKLMSEEGRNSGVFFMIDVDYFKSINDTYGHPYGDTVLKQVAGVIKNNFRENDIVGRMGGDEFCVFVTGTSNLRLIRQKADILNNEMKEINCGKRGMRITVSIGITVCNGTYKDFEQAYEEADKALYQAKESGRDRYCIYESENE